MLQLAFGCSADAVDELMKVTYSLANEILLGYCREVRKKFEPEYLRRRDKDKLRDIAQCYASIAFPGFIVCVDVACGCKIHVQLDGKGSTLALAKMKVPETGLGGLRRLLFI